MRIITIIMMATVVVAVLFLRCCEGVGLRGLALPDDEEDYRRRPLYRDYGLLRSRVARGDDSFDDYGHLRFGRSED